MANPDVSLALTMFNTAFGNLNTLWQFFSGVSLAVIGYAWTQKPEARGRAKIALGIGFAIFAVANHVAMTRVLKLLAASREAARSSAIDDATPIRSIVAALPQTDPPAVRAFQASLAIGVLVALYFAHRRDRRRLPGSGNGVDTLGPSHEPRA